MFEYLKNLFWRLFGNRSDDTGATPGDTEPIPGNDIHESQPDESGNKTSTSNDEPTPKPSPSHEKTENQKRTPRNIGGRRPSSRGSENQSRSTNSSTPKPRPELLCRKQSVSQQWEIALYAPDGCEIKAVRQNDTFLPATDDMYCVPSFEGNIAIDYEGRQSDITLFDGENPLIFKFPKRWQGDGRRVRGITKGYFIAIVPSRWTRLGHVPIEPGGCVDLEFLAHYFYASSKDVGNEAGAFKECGVLTTARFSISGTQIEDDSDQGSLFVGSPPKLETAANVVLARIGEEDSDDWKGENFMPSSRSLEEILDGRQGRFYIRVYDENQMVDSGEFRYCANLQKILVNGVSYTKDILLAPTPAGHKPASIEFVSTHDGNTIRPRLVGGNSYATVEPDGTITVKSHQSGDEVQCILGKGSSRIEAIIKLPRIWWKIVANDSDDGAWSDTPLAMTREEFIEYAYSGTALRLKIPDHIPSIHAGFGNNLNRTLRVADGIPLNGFVSYSEIENPSSEQVFLKVGICETQIPVIRVLPNSPPPSLEIQEEMPRPRVKYSRVHWRGGKGYSPKELKDAGISSHNAQRMHCPIDKRRRSSHGINVNALMRILNHASGR